jgi:FAD/FMN-containing dehydrogenase
LSQPCIEFSGSDEDQLSEKIEKLKKDLMPFGYKMRHTKKESDAEKYWTIRRESFNLLRKHIKGKRTAPFIDDICVRPEFLPEFLPKLKKILNDSKLLYTIAGHAGNGNFHIIPLMDMKDHHNRALIPIVSKEVYNLVKKYEGTITAEHNDGIIRTPYLDIMYPPQIIELFKKTKLAFDPQNIFNPGKKTGITIEYMVGHLAKN